MDNGITIVEPHLTDVIPALTFGPFIATPTGLTIDAGYGEIPFEMWAAYGEGLQVIGMAYPWVVGDWLAWGERTYGEKYPQAVAVTGHAIQTLYNQKYVCDHVPKSVRRVGANRPSFATHAEVASLPVEKQAILLEQADNEHWTRDDMRVAVHGEKSPEELAAELERAFARLLSSARGMMEYASEPGDVECLLSIVAMLEDRGNDGKDDG
jgi:hypothetical protein